MAGAASGGVGDDSPWACPHRFNSGLGTKPKADQHNVVTSDPLRPCWVAGVLRSYRRWDKVGCFWAGCGRYWLSSTCSGGNWNTTARDENRGVGVKMCECRVFDDFRFTRPQLVKCEARQNTAFAHAELRSCVVEASTRGRPDPRPWSPSQYEKWNGQLLNGPSLAFTTSVPAWIRPNAP